ncbi:hypothetical protein [Aliiroseovarius sp. S253]|uniref:hypothetical protein n=1 Tax=Aliiroseovarius sp. S253 TaxID=3415133 RepID=UPI003C7E20DF
MTEHWYSNRTQIYWTCKALVQGRIINHMDEIGEVRGWRLGAIIHTLRSQYSWPIETDYRGPERIAHYRLPGRCDWQALEFPKSAIGLREELQGEARGCAQAEGEGAEVPEVPPHG